LPERTLKVGLTAIRTKAGGRGTVNAGTVGEAGIFTTIIPVITIGVGNTGATNNNLN
jgi:hypothetical protein